MIPCDHAARGLCLSYALKSEKNLSPMRMPYSFVDSVYTSGDGGGWTMKRLSRAIALILLVASFPCGAGGDSGLRRPRPTSLFDGKSLAGWEGKLDLWTVEDGELVGRMRNFDRCEPLHGPA